MFNGINLASIWELSKNFIDFILIITLNMSSTFLIKFNNMVQYC